MKNPGRRFDAIESQAAAWLVRRDGGMTATEAAEFARWCASDPRHTAAVQGIESTWAAFDRPSTMGRTGLLRDELRALDARARRRWRARGAAAMVSVACGLALYLGIQRSNTHDTVAVIPTVATAAHVSGPERQMLSDGSVVEFKPGATITVAFSEERRVVILRNGEAHFSVTPNPQRPFIVEAGSVKIRAVGTAFAVQLGGTEVEVLVTEGKVTVASPSVEMAGTATSRTDSVPIASPDIFPLVSAGQRTSVPLLPTTTIAPVLTISPAELAERLSWRVPRLEFSETTVSDAIALFGHHSPVRLRAADGEVAAMRVTGVFRSDNIDGFVRALETSLGLRAEYGVGEIRLHRGKWSLPDRQK
ncbi:MAG: FecR domain-containing protein [Opitutaceae bacterium]|nr:FecR domain-containing protein [Opitutaceae bacterium]